MALETLNNGDQGAEFRAKLNSNFTRLTQDNPFNPVLKKIAAGQDALIQVWGDSTTIRSPTRRYVAQWATELDASARLAITHGIRIYEWSSSQYVLAETIRTGTSGKWLDIYLASVSGSIPRYFMGGFFYRALAVPAADMVFLGHGINIKAFVNIEGEYVTAIEQYRTLRPEVPFLATTQHPLQADTSGETSWRPALLGYAEKLGISVDDTVYQLYLDAGKPNSYYNGDGIHESTDIGCALYVTMLNQWWDAAYPAFSKSSVPRLLTPAANQQLIVNGDFASWTDTATAPDGWSSTGPITFSKDTSIYADPRKPFSARMTVTGGTGMITHQVSASKVGYAGRGPLSLVARMRKDTDGNGTIGRLGLAWVSASEGSGFLNSTGNQVQQDDFSWVGLIGVDLPDDLTLLTVRVYIDSSAIPVAGKGIWLDQVSLVNGWLPFAYR